MCTSVLLSTPWEYTVFLILLSKNNRKEFKFTPSANIVHLHLQTPYWAVVGSTDATRVFIEVTACEDQLKYPSASTDPLSFLERRPMNEMNVKIKFNM